MPSPAWLTLNGEEEVASGASGEDSIGKQSKASHEDEIMVLGIEQVISLPTDPISGQATGAPISEGITFIKLIDQSSPLLMQSMSKGEVFESSELKYYRTSPEGEEEHYFTQLMENVVISNVQTYMPNCLDPCNANFTHMEKVTLRYEKSTWTHEVAGTEGSFSVGIFESE